MNFTTPNIYKILKYQLIILVGIFVVLEGALSWHLYKIIYVQSQIKLSQLNNKISAPLKQPQISCRQRLNGQPCQTIKTNLYPVAVIIDNQFEAWPNYGLSQAKIVYETLVEGGVTRLLAFYTPDLNAQPTAAIEKIGPIRSARPYFVTIAKEYEALLAHAGGSPQALDLIEKLKVHNLEEIAWWGPDYFWRVYSRQAPHNLFTSSKKLAQAAIDWELKDKTPTYRNWQFTPQLVKTNYPIAQKIKIYFSDNPLYNIQYKYNTSTQTYLRYQDKKIQIDALNKQLIQPKNIVIQFVPPEKILDSTGRLKIDLIGHGPALLFRDGIKINGQWKKLKQTSRTIFYDEQNKAIKFKPGLIWIEIVPAEKKIKIN